MSTNIRGWGDRLFPEFQILIRRSGRVAYVHLTSTRQAALVATLIGSCSLIAYLGARYEHFDRAAVSRDVELTRAEDMARADHDKALLEEQISQLKVSLSDAQSRVAAATEQEKIEISQQQTEITAKLAQLAKEKEEVAKEKDRLNGMLTETQLHLGVAVADSAQAISDREELERRVSQTETDRKTLEQRFAQSDNDRKELEKRLAQAETDRKALDRKIAQSDSDRKDMERKLAQADNDRKDMERKLAQSDNDREDMEHDLAASEDKIKDANGKLANLAQSNAQLAKSLESDHDEFRHTDAKQASLVSRVVSLQKELEKAGQEDDSAKFETGGTASVDEKPDAEEKPEKTIDKAQEKMGQRVSPLRSEVANIERKLQNIVTDHYQLATEQTETAPAVAVASSNAPTTAPAATPVASAATPAPVTAQAATPAAAPSPVATPSPAAPAVAAIPAPVAPAAAAPSAVAPVAAAAPIVVTPVVLTPAAKPAAANVGANKTSENKTSELERLIASTGINVSRLMKDIGSAPRAEGGPYVALSDAPRVASDAERQEILQKLAQTLPLKAPLDEYRLESPFGARIDPINHRKAFHSGLDMSAPYRTHVYSTAPGTVRYSGSEEGYGRVVEIDHGHGILTRYAHLHRSFVVKGQKVSAHTAIGELGSTGRSTGPHVHYEIVVDGVPQDPAKFIGVGKNVVQAGVN